MKKLILKNKIASIIVATLLVISLGGGVWIYTSYAQEAPTLEPGQELTVEVDEASSTDEHVEVEEERTQSVEQEFPMDMGEGEVRTALHLMSHQKVKAKKKWGALPLTEERVDRLITVVQSGDYNNGNQYLDILNAWKNKDFSQADKHHNTIWRMQNGTVGKATGVLNKAQEVAFVEEKFGKKEE
ncbi:DUF6241 domain-containing protein [Halobacillus salinus]|uniref:DUF6241 domain-containing protein n=1 Tax=Halobacillus salinus TaxID=192814 RepID=UPI0009A5B6BB|nr:DUF6241 domain-containing protein [Halobacillus salinus]